MSPEDQPVPEEIVEYDPEDNTPVGGISHVDAETEKAIQAGTQVVFNQKKGAV